MEKQLGLIVIAVRVRQLLGRGAGAGQKEFEPIGDMVSCSTSWKTTELRKSLCKSY